MTKKEIVETLERLADEIEKGSKMFVYINNVMLTNNFSSGLKEKVRFEVKKPCVDDSQYWVFLYAGYSVVTVIMGDNIEKITIEVRE